MGVETRAKAVAAGIGAGMVSAMALLTLSGGHASARAIAFDGLSAEIKAVSKTVASDPSGARVKMRALYRQNGLRSGADYAEAAKVVMTSGSKDDLALAHDLAIAGVALGNLEARPLVARTEDRLYALVGLGERYGTLGGKSLPLTDRHRSILGGFPNLPVRAQAASAE